MNRTKKFLYNSMTTAILQVITMMAGFITPRVMLQAYGSEINGLVSSITQFILYFNLVEAGLSGAAVYALYKPIAENNYKKINGVVSGAKRFYCLAGYIFVALTLGLATIYPMFVKIQKLSSISVGVLVLILGTSGTLEFFTMAKYRVLLTADQKQYVISITSIIAIILNTIIIVVLASQNVNIVMLRFIALFSVFLRSIILSTYVKAKYPYINYKEKPNTEALNKRWDALYLQILNSIQIGSPVVIATIFTNLKMVSVYTIFNMVIGGINGVLSIFISGLSASFGDIIVRNEKEKLQRSYQEFEFVYYALITFVYGCAMVLIMPFIKVYTSGINDVNYNQPVIGFLFVLNGLLYNIKTPQGMLVISAGMYKETRNQTTIQGIITVVVSIALAPIWGIAGILIGSVLANLYRSIDLLFFIPHNITKLKVLSTFKRMVRVAITIILILIPFFFIKLTPNNYIKWFASAIIVAIYSFATVIIVNFLLEREIFYNVINRIKRLAA